MLTRLKEEKNIDWNVDCPDWYKWGTFIKKEGYLLETETPTKAKVMVKRHRTATLSFPLSGFSLEHMRFLLCKEINNTEKADVSVNS